MVESVRGYVVWGALAQGPGATLTCRSLGITRASRQRPANLTTLGLSLILSHHALSSDIHRQVVRDFTLLYYGNTFELKYQNKGLSSSKQGSELELCRALSAR
jgi:hypothetical protein